MDHIICKIQVISCESTSYIVILLSSALSKLLELRNDHIIAAAAVSERTHLVIDLTAAIQA